MGPLDYGNVTDMPVPAMTRTNANGASAGKASKAGGRLMSAMGGKRTLAILVYYPVVPDAMEPVLPRVQPYLPLALGGVCLVAALYLSVTDAAYLMRGCRVEDYPEAFFLFFVAPAALLASVLAIRFIASRRRSLVVASVVLSVLCVAAMVFVLTEPATSFCKPA
jgi:hypothetical protein